MEEILLKIQEVLALYGLRVLAALATLIIGKILAKFACSLLKKAMVRAKVDETLINFAVSVSYVALMAFVVVSALGRLGIATASFVAILGAAGLAVGLALQGSLANFASGVLMVIFKPFKVGDFVDAGGTAGVVLEIGIFNTELKTPDNKKIIVPNANITSNNITNVTANPDRRVDLVVGVGYQDDIDKVRKVLEDILAADERVLKDPEPTIGVIELGESSVNFAVRPWVKGEDYWATLMDLNETIKKRFDAEGISIPYPQQDVHLFQVEK